MNPKFISRLEQFGEQLAIQGVTQLAEDLISGIKGTARSYMGGGDFNTILTQACGLVTRNKPDFPDGMGCGVAIPQGGSEVFVIAFLLEDKLYVKTFPLKIPMNQVPSGFGNYLTMRSGHHSGNGAWCIREAGREIDVSFIMNAPWSGLNAQAVAQMLLTVSREYAETMSRF